MPIAYWRRTSGHDAVMLSAKGLIHVLGAVVAVSFILRQALPTGNLPFLVAAIIGGIALLAFMMMRERIGIEVHLIILMLIVIYIMSLMRNDFVQGRVFLPIMLANLGLAIGVLKFPKIFRFLKWLFFGLFTYFVLCYLAGVSLDDVFSLSRNHISTLFIMIAAALLLVEYNLTGKVILLPAILAFIASVLARGSGGMIASSFLLLGLSFVWIFGERLYSRILLILLVSVVLMGVGFVTMLEVSEFVALLAEQLYGTEYSQDVRDRFDLERLLGGDRRYTIWAAYFHSLSPIDWFTGTRLNEEYAGVTNVHSSYLLLHARAGLLVLPVFLILIWVAYRLFVRSLAMFVVYVAILLRSASDTVIFGVAPFDWVLLALILSTFATGSKSDVGYR
ncbi:MAG: hypothetical protein AAF438_11310 [Pseudomonadota bacterium]